MIKNFFLLIIIFFICVIYNNTNAQIVKIVNEINDFPIPGVTVFNSKLNKSTVSDVNGIININIFLESDSLFFKHIAFKDIVFTKKDLRQNSYYVFLIPNEFLLSEIRIVGSNARENPCELPYKLDKIFATDIQSSSAQTSADILLSTGNVMVQKSQGGGGSPILRGFEANKILLVIDGVRLNNAIYRSGHLQNAVTIDNSILEKINIIYGTASVIYGSDALGGVIHYFTKKPELAVNNTYPIIKFNSYDRFITASSSYVRHADFSIGYKHIGSLTSVTYSKFGDLKIGKNRTFSGDNNNWGLNKYYSKQINEEDSTVKNKDPLVQKKTAYTQYDFLQKIRYSPIKQIDFVANIQYSTSNNINRYDNLTSFSGDNLTYAEWFYGPQNRFLSSFESIFKPINNPLFTNMKSIIAFQQIEESRHSRKFGKTDILRQTENLNIYSFNLDFLKIIDLSRLNYGIEVYHNDVKSKAYYENIYTNEQSIAQTRYPDGGSLMTTTAAYVNFKFMFNEMNILTFGARYSYIKLNSKFNNDHELVQLPFSSVDISSGAPTGSISYIWFPTSKWQLTTTASSGFRSPNVDDFGKIRAKKELVTVPYDGIKPEYAYNTEISITRNVNENFRINATAFNTWLDDAIVRSFYSLNDNDSLEYDGDKYRIITNKNAGKAVVRGISVIINGNWKLDSLFGFMKGNFKLKSTFNYIKGKNISENVPLGHIPPFYGLTSIEYKEKKLSLGASIVYNGLKKIEDMSPFGEDNDEYGNETGFPAWYTLNTTFAYRFTRKISLRIAVENIFDEHYRAFASGISAPGRSFILTFNINI